MINYLKKNKLKLKNQPARMNKKCQNINKINNKPKKLKNLKKNKCRFKKNLIKMNF